MYRETYNRVLETLYHLPLWLFDGGCLVYLSNHWCWKGTTKVFFFVGLYFSNVYSNQFRGLSLWALEDRKLRFPVRPKMHSLEHMSLWFSCQFFAAIYTSKKIDYSSFRVFLDCHAKTKVLRILDFLPVRGNPRFYQCLLDEDLIRRVPLLKQFWNLTLPTKKSRIEIIWHHTLLDSIGFSILRLSGDMTGCTTNMFFFGVIKIIPTKVKAIVKGVHAAVFSERTLEHYCTAVCLRWMGIVP